MQVQRPLTLALLALATATTAAGCGRTAPGAAATPRATAGQTIMAIGVERKLGYDWARYQQDEAPKANPVTLPTKAMRATSADLRKDCPPVYDQGKLGSCTAFACSKGMKETTMRQAGATPVPLSALFGYYETRASVPILGWIMVKKDCGGTISGAVGAIAKKGTAAEATWPYDIAKFAEKPPAAAYESAASFKFKSAKQLGGLNDVKTTLSNGRTVAFGFKVYESFKKIGADGVMPVPASSEKMLGGHAVLAVGYDDAKKSLIVRNSWSEKWGDKGYFYMPYSVAGSADAMDYWVAE